LPTALVYTAPWTFWCWAFQFPLIVIIKSKLQLVIVCGCFMVNVRMTFITQRLQVGWEFIKDRM